MPDWIAGLASDLTRPFQTVRGVWWLVTTLTGVGLVIAAQASPDLVDTSA